MRKRGHTSSTIETLEKIQYKRENRMGFYVEFDINITSSTTSSNPRQTSGSSVNSVYLAAQAETQLETLIKQPDSHEGAK